MEVEEAKAQSHELEKNWELSQKEIEELKSELENQINEKQYARNALLKNYTELTEETTK